MTLYKILNQTNLCYNEELITKSQLLYDGGYKIMEQAQLFLPKLSIESTKTHKERLKCASYLPYLAEFVNHFKSYLFSDDLTVAQAADADDSSTLGTSGDDSFYKLFSTNCDNEGTSLHNFMSDVFGESLYCPVAYVGVDFDTVSAEDQPNNLLEEESRGLSRAYLYEIEPKTVIDWKLNKANQKFEWVKLKNDVLIQEDPLLPPQHKVQFKIWRLQNNIAHWCLYESRLLPLNKEPAPNDDLLMVDEGETTFRELPIFRLQIPDGLHVGAKLGPICEELFQRRSFLVSNMNKTCITIPVYKMGSEISAPGDAMVSEKQSDPNRANVMLLDLVNKGYTCIGSGDDIELKEATGSSHALVDKQLNELIEKMHELVSQMANSVSQNNKALGRSAASKGADRMTTEILLSAYSRVMKDFVKEIFNCIAAARNEAVIWVINGLSTFVEEDRSILMAEAVALAGKQPLLSLFPSKTLHKKWLYKLGRSFVGTLSEEEEQTVQEELETGIEAGEHMPAEPPSGPPAKMPQSPLAASSAPEETEVPLVGKSGATSGYEGMHLQTGQHIDANTVYSQLAEDYKPKDIEFIKHIPWTGPQEVPLSSIDFSNKDNWQASSDPNEIQRFVDKITNDNYDKPIILFNNPSNDNKFQIGDGHHRALAYLQLGQPIPAYIGQIGSDSGPWDRMHNKQNGSVQKSNQMNKVSAATQQSNKSSAAKNGKTNDQTSY